MEFKEWWNSDKREYEFDWYEEDKHAWVKSLTEAAWNAAQEQQQQTIKELAEGCKNAGRVLKEFYEDNGINGNQPQVLKLEALAAQYLNTESDEK